MGTAIELFSEAIELAPDFALAYAFLAQTYAVQVSWGFVLPTTVLPRAREAAEKAVELDPMLPDAYAALGIVDQYDFNREAADLNYRKSLELRPDDPVVLMWLGSSLVNSENTEEGIRVFEKAFELDPLSVIVGMNWMIASTLRRDCAPAEAEMPRLRALHGDHDGFRQRLGECLEAEGRYDEAIELLKSLPDDPSSVWALGRIYARTGKTAEAMQIVSEVNARRQNGYFPISINAVIFSLLGDLDRAMDLFELAYKERDPNLPWMYSSPSPAALQADPRYRDLMRKLGYDRFD
jgi:tetratricopeptide (TPR) repeat protein